MPTAVRFLGVEAFTRKLTELPHRMVSGVKVVGPAIAYASIWELGAAHLSQPGPKTMWSTNADGEETILTIQAPHGYIRINRRKYIEFLEEEYHSVNWGKHPLNEWEALLRDMMVTVANRCAALISASAPVDSGQLSESIEAVEPGDPLIDGTSKEHSAFKDTI